MSTFRGIVAEFPRIRIDYFRQQPEHKPPLACFLSHVHSDHLTGLESLRAPFVYCSAATREILLRLEKYRYRVNFAKGILESRNVTYDRSMRTLAKPLPLDTPTTIELAPGNSIRVTCIDANHCVGAVMFLIEGDGKAILYTGDIRAEVWWVNSLVQNPVLLPYTLGPRRLDCIYLDTTFATKNQPYREFPSKAAGIQELLGKVSEYSDDTIFYFHAWTFGYENVWIALATFLNSRIHVDSYRSRVYGSLSTLDRKQLGEIGLHVSSDNRSLRESGLEIREAPALCGFRNGNHIQPGCLTSLESARIHSCERGMSCQVMDNDIDARIVHIIPIVTCANGTEIPELGAGGGQGDLDQGEELETGTMADIGQLMKVCAATIGDEVLCAKVLALLEHSVSNGNGKLKVSLQTRNPDQESQEDFSLPNLVSVLSTRVSSDQFAKPTQNRTIRFPYSRHSSFSELCGFLAAFRPSDVYPCTVDNDCWTPAISMRSLFGNLCCSDVFRHDAEMMISYETRQRSGRVHKRERSRSRSHTDASGDDANSPILPKRICWEEVLSTNPNEDVRKEVISVARSVRPDYTRDIITGLGKTNMDMLSDPANMAILERPECPLPFKSGTSNRASCKLASSATESVVDPTRPFHGPPDNESSIPAPQLRIPTVGIKSKLNHMELAYNAAIGFGLTWSDYGGLVSTRSKADQEEQEL